MSIILQADQIKENVQTSRQILNGSVVAVVRDFYNQSRRFMVLDRSLLVVTEVFGTGGSSPLVDLTLQAQSKSSSVTLIGALTRQIVNGRADFSSQFGVDANPGTSTNVLISPIGSLTSVSVELEVKLRLCRAGEFLRGTECVLCPRGSYSSGALVDSCSPCPAGELRKFCYLV